MNISISKEEFSAVSEAIDFITTGLEAADENVATGHRSLLNSLYSICEKYKRARAKEEDLRIAEKVIRNNSNKPLSKNELRKIARKVINNMNNETE